MESLPKKRVNIYKWIVFALAAHKSFKLIRALVRARRLKKKRVAPALIAQYSDL